MGGRADDAQLVVVCRCQEQFGRAVEAEAGEGRGEELVGGGAKGGQWEGGWTCGGRRAGSGRAWCRGWGAAPRCRFTPRGAARRALPRTLWALPRSKPRTTSSSSRILAAPRAHRRRARRGAGCRAGRAARTCAAAAFAATVQEIDPGRCLSTQYDSRSPVTRLQAASSSPGAGRRSWSLASRSGWSIGDVHIHKCDWTTVTDRCDLQHAWKSGERAGRSSLRACCLFLNVLGIT